MTCDNCGNNDAILAPHTGMTLCDCCTTFLLIGQHRCLSHKPKGSDLPCRTTLSLVPNAPPHPNK